MERNENKQAADEPLKGRAKFVALLKDNNSEADYDNDDVFFDELDKYNTGRNEMLDRYRESSKALSELFANNPEVGMFISDLKDGMDVLESISSNFGDIFGDEMQDEESRKRYRKGLEAHKNRAAALEKVEQQKQANVEKYTPVVEEFVGTLPEEEKEAFATFLGDAADKIYMWEFDKDFLTKMYKAMKYDAAVAEAKETGEVKGRNEQITMKKGNVKNDGTPVMNGGRNTPKKNGRTFSFTQEESIWDK